MLIGVGLVVAMAAGAQASSAARWCSRDGVAGFGNWICSYHTFQQCLAAVSGAGGTCEQNPNYVPARQVKPRRQKPARRY